MSGQLDFGKSSRPHSIVQLVQTLKTRVSILRSLGHLKQRKNMSNKGNILKVHLKKEGKNVVLNEFHWNLGLAALI